MVLNVGVDLDVVAQEHRRLTFSQGRANTSKPQDGPFVTGFFAEFPQCSRLWTFARVDPAFRKTPFPLVGA